MNTQEAAELVKRALSEAAPGAELATLPPDADIRDVLELDSLDFLNYVQLLSDFSGCRVEEDDYPTVSTLAGGASFLATRCGTG